MEENFGSTSEKKDRFWSLINTIMNETKCDGREWHIARLHKMLSEAYFAWDVVIKKKCISKII